VGGDRPHRSGGSHVLHDHPAARLPVRHNGDHAQRKPVGSARPPRGSSLRGVDRRRQRRSARGPGRSAGALPSPGVRWRRSPPRGLPPRCRVGGARVGCRGMAPPAVPSDQVPAEPVETRARSAAGLRRVPLQSPRPSKAIATCRITCPTGSRLSSMHRAALGRSPAMRSRPSPLPRVRTRNHPSALPRRGGVLVRCARR